MQAERLLMMQICRHDGIRLVVSSPSNHLDLVICRCVLTKASLHEAQPK